MVRAVVLVALLAAACHHKGSAANGSGPPPLIKRVVVTWDSGPIDHNKPDKLKVYLVTTDETGSANSYPMSEATGTCGPAPLELHDLTAYACTEADGSSLRFHATRQAADVVILAEKILAGGASDLMNATVVGRVTLPIDAKVEGGT